MGEPAGAWTCGTGAPPSGAGFAGGRRVHARWEGGGLRLGSGVELVGKPGCVLKSFGLQVRFGGGGDNTTGMGGGCVECDCVRSWVLSLPR